MDKIAYLCVFLIYINIEAKCYLIESCTYDRERDGVKVNCSSQEFLTVPDFCQNTQAVKTVSNRTITIDPSQIIELDLSNNSIGNFSQNPFYCLENLKVLNLERNEVKLSNENYFKGLFSPLVSLRYLNIKHNSEDGFINDTVFAELKELEVIRIDTPNGTVFGEHFSQLRRLHILDLSGINGYCYIRRIKNTTFQYFPFLSILDLSACRIKNVDVGAFGILEHLSELFLSYNIELGFASLQNITFNLQYTNIKKLHLENIRCLGGADTQLFQSHLEYLSNTSLEELNLAGNRLQWIGECVLHNLPKTLQNLSLANNRLSVGIYSVDYRLLEELKVFNASYQLNLPNITTKLFQRCDENPDIRPSNCTSGARDQLSKSNPCKIKKGQDLHLEYKRASKIHSELYITFYAPPKLEILYWTSSRVFGVLGKFGVHAPSLRKIFVQNNIWYSWKGPVYGLEAIEELDLSQNFCYNISTEFLSHAPGVKILKLRDNNIARSLSSDSKGLIFRSQRNLEFLDLSNNDIEYLPEEIFKNSTNIKQLLLQDNRLNKWGVKINHMKNLTFLDLSDESGHHIRLAIMHRDMEPHGDHANNIMDYISRSKRTICVVSKNFLESDWQDYELNMARMEGVQTRKTLNFVHLILMPDVCKTRYPQKASDFIKKGYYQEYPEEPFGYQMFWETLRQEIEKDLYI
ncbi:toll-like receptor 4 [Saccostrea echinata]|uniref:toll-like receptor 4 n=1 Tax=Saccostrea echinata TaxID=191078 RepID=UPI002A83EEA7|nr:toll-like receptor 4 [Saccostrea echinata]